MTLSTTTRHDDVNDLPARPETKPAERFALGFEYLSPQAYLELPAEGAARPLAAILHGAEALPARPWPQISSGLPSLTARPQVELLLADGKIAYRRDDSFDLAETEDLLFGAFRLDAAEGAALAEASERLYGRLLRLIRRRGHPHLLRMWNILQDINGEQEGLERYRRFCVGRHEAFAEAQAGVYPAASGVGSAAGGLCVYFLAGKQPGQAIENPRQVSAYRYPPQHGPRSPSFARGAVQRFGGEGLLFLSGTASITGHESRHLGDLPAQVEETLANLRALVGVAEETSGLRFDLKAAAGRLKAYIRRAEDYPAVRRCLERSLGEAVEILYLRADICRRELLFEIDGALRAAAAS